MLKDAIKRLKENDVVAIPTETVYGLAARIDSPEGIEKIFRIKERPFFDPLIVHVSDVKMAKTLTDQWNKTCDLLAKNFWPGPLTIVLKKNKNVSDMITAGLDSVGIRCPNHDLTLSLIEEIGVPLAAPSANKFKKTSPTKASHVKEEFGDQVTILDGGECEVGIESTVVAVIDNRVEIYRPGMITKNELENFFKQHDKTISVSYKESPVAPGQLEHHYMPKIPVILNWSGKKPQLSYNAPIFWKIEETPELVARNLYSFFRESEKASHDAIVLELDPKLQNQDEWQGILNRLKKAKSQEII